MIELIIRPPSQADETLFLEAMEASQSLHFPWVSPPRNSCDFANWLARSQQTNHCSFLACHRDGTLIGVFNLSEIVRGGFQSAYLGYYSVGHYAGRGYMSQGLKLVLKNIFQVMQLHRVEANIQPENMRSKQLVQANGFIKEGFSPRYLKVQNVWCDHERWALTYEDWMAGHSKE